MDRIFTLPVGNWHCRWWILLLLCLPNEAGAVVAEDSARCWEAHWKVGDVVVVQLNNGDQLSGEIQQLADSTLQLQTAIGRAIIHCWEVVRLESKDRRYRLTHYGLWMPSAEPIGTNAYVGLTGLMLLHGGIGIGSWLSLSAARSVLPMVRSQEQITVLHMKLSSPITYKLDALSKIRFATGVVLGWLNAANPLHHLYVVATVHRIRSRISALVFYRVDGPELFTVRFGELFATNVRYPRGSVGLALSADVQLPYDPQLHVLGELWNINIAKPTQTAFTLAVRFAHSFLTGDFGVALFPSWSLIPYASVWWTP